ncbi:hypothetical protein OG440_38210 (plasmid) [Streptomyces sp. NBC_00637]|uniref:hypothetical protein n=1 Tax=Streptomyces sp. NBC_00637 TaxID=2903667 RepID=UPI002F90D303
MATLTVAVPTLIASAAALAVGSHALGASGLVPRAVGRLRRKVRAGVRSGILKPAWHPARWSAEAAFWSVTSAKFTRAFAVHPRRSVSVVRQYRAIAARRQPRELREAVAETAALHLPGCPVTLVRFPVYQPQGAMGLDNVYFRHGRDPENVTRITLGGNPDWMGGLAPGQASREQLEASRERVRAALAALPIGPDVRSVMVSVDRRGA